MSDLLQTPLHSEHRELGARMAEFGGWHMPIQYSGILAEHQHTREKACVFDISHMGEFELSGSTAAADLDRVFTADVSSMEPGQARYGYLLNEEGGVIDDVICFRMEEDLFWVVANAGTRQTDADWIRSHLSPETIFQDISDSIAKLDIQGPLARTLLEAALGETLPDLGYFRFVETDLCGHSCYLSRTGYTGEFGYELYLPAQQASLFWKRILASGDILPAGLGARDTLRLEAGYPLYGHELSATLNPVSTSRGMFISKPKLADRAFIGSEAIAEALENGLPRYLTAIQLDGRQAARAHDRIRCSEKEIGEITSGAYAPSLGHAVAMAFVDAEYTPSGTKLTLINSRGRELAGTVSTLPFYTKGTARKGTGT